MRYLLRAANGVVLAFPIALFAFALATDIAYLQTAELQWTNISSWAIAVGLVFGGCALIFALLGVVVRRRAEHRAPRLTYALALAAMCGLGLLNAFKHSQDGWSSVGMLGLVLSVLTTAAAMVAGAIGYSGVLQSRDAR